MPYPIFDRSRLKLRPLAERVNDLDLSVMGQLDDELPPFENPDLPLVAERIVQSHRNGGMVILTLGAHLIRRGAARYIIDLMRRGVIKHVAMNGAGPIHDFEFALIGATTESVARYISTGEFGLWQETGRINEALAEAQTEGLGFGEAVGRTISQGDFPHKEVSVLAAGYELGVPVSVHVGIGCDILHEHPNCDGAALGAATYRDFLTLAHSVEQLEGGVLLNFGTAVMGPETYLKALAMARNVAHQGGRRIARFTTAVFDLLTLPENYREPPPRDNPHYYYRPWKTILVRTVADGGESFYLQGDHRVTFPNLYRQVIERL